MPGRPFEKGHKINLGRVPWNKIPRATKPEMELPLESEVLWAAGFWEGEGSLSTRSVSASQVDAWPLERLQRAFGGTIGLRDKGRRINQRPCHQWFLCGDAARLFVHLIYPHVSPRRQAQINEKFITHDKRQRMRASIKEASRAQLQFRTRDERGRLASAKVS